ncbi:MAG TPA: UvrB/UvrC motif-containing protein, partial [Polyangiaceae bacterium]|nr:UvrB/UvrC motif-containing protein [Polyangiaceae bacterium]
NLDFERAARLRDELRKLQGGNGGGNGEGRVPGLSDRPPPRPARNSDRPPPGTAGSGKSRGRKSSRPPPRR